MGEEIGLGKCDSRDRACSRDAERPCFHSHGIVGIATGTAAMETPSALAAQLKSKMVDPLRWVVVATQSHTYYVDKLNFLNCVL